MIVFDLDDTLYRERDFEHSGWEAVTRAKRMDTQFDINGKWDAKTLNIYRTHIPEISLSEDAVAALEYLKASGTKIGIITDGRSVTQRNKFIALGLYRYISPDDLIISDEIGDDKLSSLPFKFMMQKHPFEAEWTYIGDNPAKDFYMPNRLGWTTVMLLHPAGYTVHPQTLNENPLYQPQIIIENIYEYVKDRTIQHS